MAARPTLDQTFLRIAKVCAARGDCARRQVGCVLTDAEGNIVSTGWNGRPKIMGNCSDTSCMGDCQGIHAEVNALLRANGKARTCYVTCAPCWHCMKTIANSGVTRVVYIDASTLEDRSALLAIDSGIRLEQMNA